MFQSIGLTSTRSGMTAALARTSKMPAGMEASSMSHRPSEMKVQMIVAMPTVMQMLAMLARILKLRMLAGLVMSKWSMTIVQRSVGGVLPAFELSESGG